MSESESSNKTPVSGDVPGLYSSDKIELAIPTTESGEKPPAVRHMSSPAYQSPIRHHQRHESKPRRQVKETHNAKSEYSTSEDDGTSQHRINQYIIGQEIGRGSFGAVHLATDQYGQEYAVKEFSKSRLRKRAQSNLLRRPKGLRRYNTQTAAGVGFNSPLHRHGSLDDSEDQAFDLIKEEIAVMKKLNHPNVVNLIEVLDDPEEDSLYMVLEMCKKGVVMNVGLENKADPYDDETCRCYFRDMILGMEYLHAQGIIHRDIKPDNCLVTADNVVKIVDFGVSEMFEKESAMNTAKSAGSPAFMPPELCVAKHGQVSGRKADIWSMGVTLYCLNFGQIPFEKDAVLDLYESIRSDELTIPDGANGHLTDLLRRILEKDPEKRIDMDEIRDHPWVTKEGADPLLSKEDNTAELIEPPTEEEKNMAITGNMKRLLVVMKAAKRFKQKLFQRRPELMQSIFGNARFVQPPTSIRHDSSNSAERSQSSAVEDRRPLERALTAEGVHRDIDPSLDLDKLPRNDIESNTMTEHLKEEKSIPTPPEAQRTASEHRPPMPTHTASASPEPGTRRGQAHDPLEDTLFLNIGIGDETAGPVDSNTILVSESPGAVTINVYEQAYQEEIDRILQERSASEQHRRPTLFLTRRVEDVKQFRENAHLCAWEHMENVKSAGSTSKAGLAGLVAKAKANAQAAMDDHDKEEKKNPDPADTDA